MNSSERRRRSRSSAESQLSFFAHAGEVFSDFLLVNFDAFEPVGEAVELAFDDMLRRRHFLMLELFAQLAFDLAYFAAFA